MALDPLAVRRNLGLHLIARREALGMTQEAVAHKAGIGLRTLRDVEGGTEANIGIDNICAVATALGFETLHVLFCTPAPAHGRQPGRPTKR
jgi:transcriptional regulator with XRE-family HTH domain